MTCSSCCPPNSHPAKAKPSGEQGTVRRVGKHNTRLYVTGPTTAQAGLLVFPDICGPDSGRTKADCDAMGQLGYCVVLVDVTDGDYLQPEQVGDEGVAWLAKYPFDPFLKGRLQDAVDFLKHEVHVRRIGGFGYCYGAWVGARLSAEEDTPLQGNVSFHPSWVWVTQRLASIPEEADEQRCVAALAKSIKCPQLLCSAGNDAASVRPEGVADRILSESLPPSRVVEFPRMRHGWVNRGELEDPVIAEDAQKAWSMAREFLNRTVPVKTCSWA